VLSVGVPEIREPPTDVEVTEGDALHLRCTISASQRPFSTVWWLHNAVPVMSNEFVHITGKFLSNVSSLHELFDTVSAQNILGFITDIGLYRPL